MAGTEGSAHALLHACEPGRRGRRGRRAVGIVSALTPEMADRFRIVRGVLPPGVPASARDLALAFGLGLDLALARRSRGASGARGSSAVALVVGSAARTSRRGSTSRRRRRHLILLVALLRCRREFVAPGDPAASRRSLQDGLRAAVVGVLALRRCARDRDGFSERIEDALLLVHRRPRAAARSGLAPAVCASPPSPGERRNARGARPRARRGQPRVLRAPPRQELLLLGERQSFLAYRVVAGTALVAGDPIGDAAERQELVEEFRRVAHAKGGGSPIAGAADEALADYDELGFKSMYLGDEAVVARPSSRWTAGAIRKVRQSVSRLRRAGYGVACSRPDDARRGAARRSSAPSRRSGAELARARLHDGDGCAVRYPDTVLAVAVAPDGTVGGFLQLVPSPASEGYSLASMRRRKDTPNGLMEYLIAETVDWAETHDVTEVSLNFAVFADFLRADDDAARCDARVRWVLLKADRLFQLERLHSFNRKFFPHWRRRYFCFERWGDLPLAGLAYLHAESLLTPPGPWVKTPDLAAQ